MSVESGRRLWHGEQRTSSTDSPGAGPAADHERAIVNELQTTDLVAYQQYVASLRLRARNGDQIAANVLSHM